LALVEGPPLVVALLTVTVVATSAVMMIGAMMMIGAVMTGTMMISAAMIGAMIMDAVMTGAMMIGTMIGIMMIRAMMIGIMMIGMMIGATMSYAVMRVAGAMGAIAPLFLLLMFAARYARFMATLPVIAGGVMLMILMMKWIVMSRRCTLLPMVLIQTGVLI
jgi:hypothetical protein